MSRYTADDIIKRTDSFAGNRGVWEDHWQDVATYVAPNFKEITDKLTPGDRRTRELFSTTAIEDLETFVAGMSSYLIPPNKPWFSLRAKNRELMEDDDVKRWFMDATQIAREALANSNFQKCANDVFRNLGWCGTALMYAEDHDDRIINFSTFHITRFFLDVGSDGEIDTFLVKCDYTARQALQKWPSGLHEKILKAAASPATMDNKFTFIHAVYPRADRDPNRIDRSNMPWESVWVDVENKLIVSESGYLEQPYFAPRYIVGTNEVYGRSPAMLVLPKIKVENKIERTLLVASDKSVDPTLLIPDDGSVHPLKTFPGSIMYYRPGGEPPKPLDIRPNIPIGEDQIRRQQESIHAAFNVDLWALLTNRPEEKTATEVMELVGEKLVLLAPVLAPLESDFLSRVIIRTVGILQRTGKFEEMPPAMLEDPEFEISYSNRVAMAVKAQETRGILSAFDALANLFQVDPTGMDNFDLDVIAQDVAEAFGASTRVIRPTKQRDQMRKDRAAAQQAQQQAEMLAGAADAVPKLQKKTEAGAPLEQLSEMMGL